MNQPEEKISNTPVTLEKVARLSGVSRATASRALNGRDGVKRDVRERVRFVAKSLGYRPNRAAQNLSSGRSSIIGLVMPSEQLIADPYAISLLQAVARKSEERDEGLMLMLGHDGPTPVVRNALMDGLVDGVILSSVAVGPEWVEGLLDTEMPKVLIGAHPSRDDIHCVNVENLEATASIVDHLFSQGLRRIANITGPSSRVDSTERAKGFRLAHERRGIPVDESLVADGDFTQATAYRLTEKLLEFEPDAIVAANDESAIGAIQAIERAGQRVPDNVAVVGFDGITFGQGLGHKLTTMRQPLEELAGLAVSTLTSMLSGEIPPMEQTIAPKMQIGETSMRGASPPKN